MVYNSIMMSHNLKRAFLLLSGTGLILIGVFYSAVPIARISHLFDISVSSTSGHHFFRAIMGLYIAFGIFWIISSAKPPMVQTALLSLVIFMYGLSAGRLLSLFIDGWPQWLLFIFLLLEAGFGTLVER